MNKVPARRNNTNGQMLDVHLTTSDPPYIDVEFSDVVRPRGRRGYNGRALDAVDIREDYSRLYGENISLDEANRIARMRNVDEARIKSEPLIFVIFAALIAGCLLLALYISGVSAELIAAGGASLFVLLLIGVIVLNNKRNGHYG